MRRSAAFLALLFVLLAPGMARAQQTPPAPASHPQATQTKSLAQGTSSTQGNPEVQVWVNTNSGVYHCQGSHWYGATKSGAYMKQSAAQQKGYRPAYHRACK